MSQAQAFQEIVRRANAGNDSCLLGLRKLLDENPALWRAAGDVSALAERAWIDLVAGGNKLAEEAIPRRLKALKAELAGPQATPLERLLVDMVGVRWLAAEHAEAAAAEVGGSLPQATFRLKRAESAQKRFAGSVKTLALIRSLLPRGVPLLPAGPTSEV